MGLHLCLRSRIRRCYWSRRGKERVDGLCRKETRPRQRRRFVRCKSAVSSGVRKNVSSASVGRSDHPPSGESGLEGARASSASLEEPWGGGYGCGRGCSRRRAGAHLRGDVRRICSHLWRVVSDEKFPQCTQKSEARRWVGEGNTRIREPYHQAKHVAET